MSIDSLLDIVTSVDTALTLFMMDNKNNPSKDIIMSIVSNLDTSILELYRTANSKNQDLNKDTYS